MSFIKRLDQLTQEDASQVGGKAYNCACLKQAGYPVPDGFAIPVTAMAESLSAGEINELLDRFFQDTLFAVRSSAADEDSKSCSFAGIHETKVNVKAGDVWEMVKICWDSVYSPQALAYRSSQGLTIDQVQTGVLVQAMIQPLVSGVAFTANPLTGKSDELLINASWGLGEPLVSGQIQPDEFKLLKSDHSLLSNYIGSKQYQMVSEGNKSHLIETKKEERQQSTLNTAQLSELAPLLCDIEAFFGEPQDIEWCYDGARFWIVQSRPITTSTVSSGPDIEWSRMNLREVLPDLPLPLAGASLSILDLALQHFYGNLLAPEAELGSICKAIHGRPYLNLSQFRRVCHLTRTPTAALLRLMGHEGEITPEDEETPRPSLLDSIRVFPDLCRIFTGYLFLDRLIDKQNSFNKADMNFMTAQSPQDLSNAQILSFSKKFNEDFPQQRINVRLTVNFGISLHETCLQKFCSLARFPYERLVHPQMAVGEKSVSTRQGFDLLALGNTAQEDDGARQFFLNASKPLTKFRQELEGSRFLVQFDRFLLQYGHRGVYESDVTLPLYHEDPTPLLQSIRTHIQAGKCQSPEKLYGRQKEEAEKSWQEFIDTLPLLKRLFLVPITRRSLRKIKHLYLCRENDRSELQRVFSMIRQYILVGAQRFHECGWIDQRDDYFYLTFDEIEATLDDIKKAQSLKAIVSRRKKRYESWRHLEMPLHMYESEAPALMRRTVSKKSVDSIGQLSGLCVGAGLVEGEVVVIRDPSEFSKMKQGTILVAPATNPAWTHLFNLATGIIVEIGGTLSHASIVAREYSLPALANVKDAVTLLNDGDMVRLDATNGLVEVVKKGIHFSKESC